MLPKILGPVNDQDTQFTAAVKKYQDFILLSGIIVMILLAYMMISSMSSKPMGTWRYGICKTFLERYTQYPTDVKILTTGEKQSSSQIGYLVTNSYGSRQSQLMECFYNIDQNGVRLSNVKIDRKPLDQDIIESFNQTVPIILAQDDLDLTIPDRLPNSLEGLKFD